VAPAVPEMAELKSTGEPHPGGGDRPERDPAAGP